MIMTLLSSKFMISSSVKPTSSTEYWYRSRTVKTTNCSILKTKE